jgi:spermidine synthase
VICFGTGQTTNAVRKEGIPDTTIVDINPAVFELSKHFPKNEAVLEDPAVHKVLMDGRAFLRRTTQSFDIVTMEPMPPNHAGVNALYSREFYELAKARLRPGGVAVQWLPAHLVSTEHARSVAKTFQDVFPNAVLWVDPEDKNGVLIGAVDDAPPLGSRWPGLDRPGPVRSLDAAGIRAGLMLDASELRTYAADGTVVTDDNQHLAYGADFNMKATGPRPIEEVRLEFAAHDVR